MKNTLKILVPAVCLVVSSALAAPPPPFEVTPLSGWEPYEAATTVPYVYEGLRSEFLYGARSPRGSWVFVTRIDNTLELPAFSATRLRAMTGVQTFADLEPRNFRTAVVEVQAEDQQEVPTVESVVRSFQTVRLPYDTGTAGGAVLVRTVYVPLVVWHQAAERYANVIYVAHFRGSPDHGGDLDRFEQLWSRLTLPPGAVLVKPERFNACRPELVRRRQASR